MKHLMLIYLSVFLLTACGGDGNSLPDYPSNDPPVVDPVDPVDPVIPKSSTIHGIAFDNLLRAAKIWVYTMDGTLVGEGQTDDYGEYSITIDALEAQPVKLVATDGFY